MKKRGFRPKVFIACLIIVTIVAFIGSIFSSSTADSEWYKSIKPSITPPSYVFPIAWTILFFMMALSLYFAWIKSDRKKKKQIIFLFGLNFLLNILWSILFFGMQNPMLAYFDLIILWISIIMMITATYKIDRRSAYLLMPYLLWVSFAGLLNYLAAF